MPGLGVVLARRSALAATAGNCASLSLDLHDQYQRLEQDGQFRFTPPTHVIAALDAALAQHAAEGGVAGRGDRYRRNLDVLVRGMRAIGFRTLLSDAVQAPVIVTFHEPADPAWSFRAFYAGLVERGFAIYPGKLTVGATFRVGCIGQVFPADLERFLSAVRELVAAMGVRDLGGAP